MTGPRPCSAHEAVMRAKRMVGAGTYILGTGSYDPKGPDVPWTERDGIRGCDCAGLAVWAYKLPRHRPGYNAGAWASVEDDLNSNSLIEDAEHKQELTELVTTPAPGVLLAYPTIRLPGHDRPWIGHVAIVVSVERATSWDFAHPPYHLLDIVQCRGPNGRIPGVIASDASLFEHHDENWSKPEHRTKMLRLVP